MANMRYLLWNYKSIIENNPNMSHLYIFYLTVLFLSSILGPSTVLLALESAITSVFEISHWLAHLVTYGPTVFFIIICLKANSNTQLNFAMVLSAMYALLMMTVFVGTFVSIASEGWYTPSGMFFYILVGTYIIAGLLHPYGLRDLVLGVIYFICIPAGYLLLIIYALCNLENISWGTRENKTADLENNTENQNKEDEKDTGIELEIVTNEVIKDTINHVRTYNEKAGSCWRTFCFVFRWINTIIIQKTLHSAQTLLQNVNNKGNNFAAQTNPGTEIIPKSNDDTKTEYKNFEELPLELLEKIAWEHIITNYLKPKQRNTEDSNKLMEMMTDLRNNVVFGFLFLNALWLTIMTAMNEAKYTINIKIPTTTPIIIEPLGFVFLLVFSLILVLQFIGMVMHRYETMLHILSITRLDSNPQSTPESASNNRNNSNSARRGNQKPLPNENPRTQAHDNLSFEGNVSTPLLGQKNSQDEDPPNPNPEC